MAAKRFEKVYVITGHTDCHICGKYGDELVMHDDPAELMDSLLLREENVALFIDVKYYIKLGAEARNRLMAVAKGVPHFRIRYDAPSDTFLCIDDPQSHASIDFVEGIACRMRKEERVPVQLNAELGTEDDPFVHNAQRTSITNISCSGCFVYCADCAPYKGFAYVRIRELSNKRPIYCNIRWKREWGVLDKFPGMGMQFVDIQDDQIQELSQMYITPYLLEQED